MLANILPKNVNNKFFLVDRLLPKKIVSEIIDHVFRFSGQKATVIFCDKLKDLGFKHAFRAAISFGKDDLIIPKTKEKLVNDAKKQIESYETVANETEANAVDLKASAKAKLVAGEALTEEEANTIIL